MNILDCWSGVAGTASPTVDCGGSGRDLLMRNYAGGIELTNKSGTDDVSIDLSSGQVTLDSTITNGTIVVRGTGNLTDNSIGATVITDGLLNQHEISSAVWDDLIADHQSAGSFGEFIVRRLLTVAKFFSLRT